MQPIDILKEDFEQTLGFIDKCDNHIFQIKNWAIATSSAVIAFSISQDHDFLALVNLPLLVVFMHMELTYKWFQDAAIQHTDDLSKRIDQFLSNSQSKDLLVNYTHSFGRKLKYPSLRRVFSILRNRNRWHIPRFYMFLALISGACVVVAKLV